jgi:CheY-like chemotaxis protein/predicted regulator of Ras-like GTPase activity (Roadblock/LC7/MglB family)
MADLATKHILIVDDDPNLAQILADGLRDPSGRYEFLIALNPTQALERARQLPIDLLITDFSMPGANGLQLVDSIRQTSPRMSVIMMTGYGTEQLEQQAADRGIEKFLNKPFGLPDIRRVVGQILERLDRTPPAPPAPEQIQQELFRHLSQLVTDTGARCAFLIQLDGNLVETAGDLNGLDIPVMATLMAANFAAVTEIARLLGNPRSFDAINHESKVDNIYSCVVGPNHLLVVIFGLAIKPGAIWYYAKKIVEPLVDLLAKMNVDDTTLPADFSAAFDAALFADDLSSPTEVAVVPQPGQQPAGRALDNDILTLQEAIDRGLLKRSGLSNKDQF